MKTKSKTVRLMDRLNRFIVFVGLMAGMTLAMSVTEFYHIDGTPASINSADGELTDNAVDYLWSTKPPTKTGLARPSLTTTPPFDAAGKTIRMVIDSAWPGDASDYNLTKSRYRICSGNWSQAPQVRKAGWAAPRQRWLGVRRERWTDAMCISGCMASKRMTIGRFIFPKSSWLTISWRLCLPRWLHPPRM